MFYRISNVLIVKIRFIKEKNIYKITSDQNIVEEPFPVRNVDVNLIIVDIKIAMKEAAKQQHNKNKSKNGRMKGREIHQRKNLKALQLQIIQ